MLAYLLRAPLSRMAAQRLLTHVASQHTRTERARGLEHWAGHDAPSGSYLGLPWRVRDVSRLAWTSVGGALESLGEHWTSLGSIRGPTEPQKFETCPVWG